MGRRPKGSSVGISSPHPQPEGRCKLEINHLPHTPRGPPGSITPTPAPGVMGQGAAASFRYGADSRLNWVAATYQVWGQQEQCPSPTLGEGSPIDGAPQMTWLRSAPLFATVLPTPRRRRRGLPSVPLSFVLLSGPSPPGAFHGAPAPTWGSPAAAVRAFLGGLLKVRLFRLATKVSQPCRRLWCTC